MSTQFNQLTPAEHERLAILAEECAEVIQVVGKILRHGYESRHPGGGPNNRELLEEELGHALFAQSFMCASGDIIAMRIQEHGTKKAEKIWKYLHHNSDGLQKATRIP